MKIGKVLERLEGACDLAAITRLYSLSIKVAGELEDADLAAIAYVAALYEACEDLPWEHSLLQSHPSFNKLKTAMEGGADDS